MTLAHLIFIAGMLHFGLLIASALTPGVLRWRTELRQLSALSRHVIWVHGAFIVAVIVGFGTISLLNAPALAGGSKLARSVCAFVSLFWLGRLQVQLFLFDARPYLRGPVLKLGYHCLTALFVYFTIIYGWAALWPHRWPASTMMSHGSGNRDARTSPAGIVLESIMSLRPIKRLIKSKPTLEGAGVHLRRAFGFDNTSEFDPFLLLDDFRNDIPEDYLAGFPWHPHRGIETITYVLAGTVDHGDSIGNRGSIAAGDVQWMTAGRGIIHQEMPKGDVEGRMHGFQLWANLPSSLKMTAPRYQEVKALDIPQVTDDDGTHVRIVCGTFWGKRGPVDGIAADPIYLDVSVPPGRKKTLPVETTRHAFAYVFAGSGKFCNASGPLAVPTEGVGWADTNPPVKAENRSLVLFDRGDEVSVQAEEDGIRFLLVSGKPLEEPVAWYGPIVMNTQEQLRHAYQELREGTFLKD